MKKIYESSSVDEIEKLLEIHKDEIIFVSFFSPTCGPCRMLEPILEELVDDEKINIIRINVLDYPELIDEFNISAWPTNLIYKNNKIIHKIVGYQPKEEWEEILSQID